MENTTNWHVAGGTNDLVSFKQLLDFLELSTTVYIVICCAGLVGNIITTKTFLSLGLKDGILLSFTALSISDLLFLLSMLCRGVFIKLFILEVHSDYKVWLHSDPVGVSLIFANLEIVLYVNTVLITTYLALARCVCVVRPLQFRNIFTRSVSLRCLAALLVFSVTCSLPAFSSMRMVSAFDHRINGTRIVFVLSSDRSLSKVVVNGVRDIFVIVFMQVIVVISVVAMARGLWLTSKFRQVKCDEGGGQTLQRSDRLNFGDSYAFNRNRKDIKVVQQVALISTIFVACNTPSTVISVSSIAEPKLNLEGAHNNIYVLVVMVAEMFRMLNASSNIFIYYNYNTNFRSRCQFSLRFWKKA